MSNTVIPVVKFMFQEDFKALIDALNGNYQVDEFSAADELAHYLESQTAGLVIAALKDKKDLIQIATFQKIVKKIAKNTAVKVVVVNISGDRNYEKASNKLGILDLIEPNINTRALKFKLDFWMKSLNAQIKKNESAAAQKVKSIDAKANEAKALDANSPTWLPPLELESDIWILKNDNDCKKILSKWLIKLLGPSPYVGQWTEIKNGQWRFDIIESEKEMYITGEGSWYFVGDQKPDYVWKENLWLIAGENYELLFKEGDKLHSRLKSQNKNLTICKNSLFAKTKEGTIIDSFDKDLVFKREADQLDDLEGKNQTDQIDGGPLSGKNKTDQIDGGPLAGKNSQKDELSGNLAGKTKGEGAIQHDNLAQKTETEKRSSHWNNKNSYETDENGDHDGPKSDNPRQGDELGRERNDLGHKSHYKNHNEAEKYDTPEISEKDRKGNGENPIPGHLTGKSKSEAKGGPEKDYDGKSETDKIQSHYGGKGNESESTPDKKDSHYGQNKGLTPEKMGHKEREEKEKSQRDLSSAQKTKKELEDLDPVAREKALKEQASAKEKNGREGDHGFGMDGVSATEKLSAHYKSRSKEVSSKDNHDSSVLPFQKKGQEEKPKTAEEKRIDELTAEAKVFSTLTQNNKVIHCEFDDFFEDTVIFKTSSQDIASGATIDMDMLFRYLDKDTKVHLKGDVVTIEGDGEGTSYISIKVNQENNTLLENFMKSYEARQNNIHEFMLKVKGH